MHALAPFPIIFGIFAILAGILWLFGVDAEEHDAPDTNFAIIFGGYYLMLRLIRALVTHPLRLLPGFGLIAFGAGLIYLGMWML